MDLANNLEQFTPECQDASAVRQINMLLWPIQDLHSLSNPTLVQCQRIKHRRLPCCVSFLAASKVKLHSYKIFYNQHCSLN